MCPYRATGASLVVSDTGEGERQCASEGSPYTTGYNVQYDAGSS